MRLGRGNKIEVAGEKRSEALLRIRDIDFESWLVVELIEEGVIFPLAQPGPCTEYFFPAIRTDDVGVLVRVYFKDNLLLPKRFLEGPKLFVMHGHQELLPGAKPHPTHPGIVGRFQNNL